jgi:hypothetical protein
MKVVLKAFFDHKAILAHKYKIYWMSFRIGWKLKNVFEKRCKNIENVRHSKLVHLRDITKVKTTLLNN